MRVFLRTVLAAGLACVVLVLVAAVSVAIPGTRANHIAKLSGMVERQAETDAQANLMMYLLHSVDWFVVCAGGFLAGGAAALVLPRSRKVAQRIISSLVVVASVGSALSAYMATPKVGVLMGAVATAVGLGSIILARQPKHGSPSDEVAGTSP